MYMIWKIKLKLVEAIKCSLKIKMYKILLIQRHLVILLYLRLETSKHIFQISDPLMWMEGTKKRLTLFNRRLPRRLGVLEWSYGLSVMKNEARWRHVCSIPLLALKISVLCKQLYKMTGAMKKVQIFTLLILMQCVVHNSQYSQSSHRRKRSYKNTLLRMHHHSWSWEDILHAVYKVLQLFLVQHHQQQQQMAAPREFLFFFDNSDNGSTPLFGLNISRRDAAYVSFSKFFQVLFRKLIVLLRWIST